VLAAAGDFADELRSLGLYDAASARDALINCLAQLDEGPACDVDAGLDLELAERLRRDQQGAARRARRARSGEVERRQARMRWALGVEVV
jgi:hypothetical protein